MIALKYIRIFGMMLLLLLASTLLFAQKELTEIEDFGDNPGNLNMHTYIPGNLDKDQPHPLIVVLHGCNQTATSCAKVSGWNELADEYGLILLYPEQKVFNNPNLCFNWFNKKDITKNMGEAMSIYEMITWMMENNRIDSSNIFVYGLSAGAAMGVVMMADYPWLFNTGAILAGGPYKSATNPFAAMKVLVTPEELEPEVWGKRVKSQNPDYDGPYPKLIIFHGKKDKVVSTYNDYELLKQWTWLHKADTVVDHMDFTFNDNPDIYKGAYYNRDSDTVVIWYLMDELGHELSVDPGDGKKQGGATSMFSKDTDFFSTWWILRDFGIAKDE